MKRIRRTGEIDLVAALIGASFLLLFFFLPLLSYFDQKQEKEEYRRWLQQTPPEVVSIIRLFDVCPLPLNEEGKPVPMRFVCNDPLLERLDFVVRLTPNFITVQSNLYGNVRLRIAEIRLANADSLSEEEKEMVCRAFKEINKRLHKRDICSLINGERYSVVKCRNNPVLRIGIPEDEINPPEEKGGGEVSVISLFSLFSLF